MSQIKINTSTIDTARLIGSTITAGHFGVNFLSSFETGDSLAGGATFDDVLLALGGISRTGSVKDMTGIVAPITSVRFPGGGLTEEFYNNTSNALSINTAVIAANSNEAGTTVAEFLSLCQANGTNMTFVMPTHRYIDDTTHAIAANAAEITNFITALLADAYAKGVLVGAIELGNEWWVSAGLTASQYGQIASAEAKVIQTAINAFRTSLGTAGSAWVEPEILVQIGTRENNDLESQAILAEFSTGGEQEAVDGFVTHRYVTDDMNEVGDPWVQNNIYTFESLGQYLTGAGWKPLSQMVSRVSEWNIGQSTDAGDVETGLRSFSTAVAMMAELTSSGVAFADFWSVEDRTKFSLTCHLVGGNEDDVFQGLSFTGEAFRMMNESLRGKTWIELYDKTNSGITLNDGNIMDVASGNNMRTAVEAFSGDNEVVLFVSNRSGINDLLNLDLSGMVGTNYHVWATKVSAEAGHETDQFSAPIITNLSGADFVMTNGVLNNFSLNAWETLRVTITIGAYGANMMGYTGNDELIGSAYGDVIDGKAGNDILSGDGGNDTMWGGDGNDELGGGNADQDFIYGGNGNDTLGGGTGNDTMYGGAGTDTAVFWGTAAISIDLAITAGQVTGYGTDVLIGIENIKTGSAADVLLGSAVNNRFDSFGGNDTLDGRDGSDSLYGGGGRDSLLGGNGNDRLDAGTKNDIAYGGAGNDHLYGGDGIDRLYGDAGIDNLYAGTGNDSIYGGTENDVLYGGSGNDAYYGGAGIDQFVFAKDEGADTVYDYIDNSDKIRITTAGLTFANLSFVAVSGGVQITHDAGDTITVLAAGLGVASFTASDFIFG